MLNEMKFRLLSYLFQDWVQREQNVDALYQAKSLIEEREYELEGEDYPNRTIIQGFKRYKN